MFPPCDCGWLRRELASAMHSADDGVATDGAARFSRCRNRLGRRAQGLHMDARRSRSVSCFLMRFRAIAAAAFVAGGSLGTSARADQGGRTWTFDLTTPGSYKVQVEHDTGASVQAHTPVTYTITIGQQTRSRQLDLVANQSFIPLITDVSLRPSRCAWRFRV